MLELYRSVRKRYRRFVEAVVPDAVRRTHLRKYTAISLIVLLAVSVVLVGIWVSVGESQRQTVRSNVNDSTIQNADAVATRLAEHRANVRLLSGSNAFTTEEWAILRSELDKSLTMLSADVRAIQYLNETTGEPIVRVSKSASSPVYNVTRWTDSVSVSPSSPIDRSDVFTVNGTEYVAFASPATRKPEHIVGIIVSLDRAFSLSPATEGGSVTVVAPNGEIVSVTGNVTGERTARAAIEPALRRTEGNATGILQTDDGSFLGHASVAQSGFSVVERAPPSSYSPGLQTLIFELMVFMMVLVGLVVVGLVHERPTARAMTQLSETARSIADGDLETDVPETGRIDEIGTLCESFEETSDYLSTAAAQAEALADREFDDPALDESVPGAFGETLDRMQTDLETLITDLEETRTEAEQAREEAEHLAAELEETAAEYSAAMAAAADGDLTQRLDTDTESDAMNEVGEAFNDMMDDLVETLVRVRSFAQRVNESSERMSESAADVEAASQQVAEAVRDISDGASQQHDNLTDVTEEVTDLSATIEEVASSADELATLAAETAETGETGSEAAEAAIDELERIETETTDTVEKIEALESEMEEIGDVVDLIDDIAEQTNTLALNASIEAARAGEAGEGFAVVADEVKSLAEETAEATRRVDDLVADVQDATTDAAEEIRSTRGRIATGVETVEEGLLALEEVVDHVDDVNASVQSISDATDEQATSTQEIVAMIEDVADTSQRTDDMAADLVDTATDQASEVGEVADEVDSLSTASDDLTALVDSFGLGAANGRTGTDRPVPAGSASEGTTDVATDGGE